MNLNPNDAPAYNNRGNAKFYLKDYRGALADYDQAIKLNPNDAQAYCGRGLARSMLGQKTEALADFQKAVELDPALLEYVPEEYKKRIKPN
ncbi:MAG: tetratricopeptide repeat protein [Candidatus Desantisbacteria bacterium]